MIVTGQRWQGMEKSVEQKTISKELTKDFLEYFVFAGDANGFMKRLGISDISFTLESQKKGIEVKKDLMENVNVGYGVEKTSGTVDQSPQLNQKIEGQYNLNKKVSISAEKEIKQTSTETEIQPAETTQKNVPNDSIMLKYKTQF